jgi:hypothetical protein
MATMNQRFLGIYLNDHVAGAIAGREVAKRAVQNNSDGPLGTFLRSLLGDIEEDRHTLQRLMERLEIPMSPVKPTLAWAAEKVGRLKLNGQLVGYSPLSRLEELEFLSLGVEGKLLLWRCLESVASSEERLAGFDFATLIKRAEVQREELERFRLEAAVDAFEASRPV